MIKIAVTVEAYDALASTFPLGSVAFEKLKATEVPSISIAPCRSYARHSGS